MVENPEGLVSGQSEGNTTPVTKGNCWVLKEHLGWGKAGQWCGATTTPPTGGQVTQGWVVESWGAQLRFPAAALWVHLGCFLPPGWNHQEGGCLGLAGDRGLLLLCLHLLPGTGQLLAEREAVCLSCGSLGPGLVGPGQQVSLAHSPRATTGMG